MIRFRTLCWAGLSCALISVATHSTQAQAKKQTPVKIEARLEPADVRAGEQAQIIVTATMEPTWHIYSAYSDENVSLPTKVELSETKALKVSGKLIEPKPEKKIDGSGVAIDQFEGQVAFALPVKLGETLTSGEQTVHVSVQFQPCDAQKCLFAQTVDAEVKFTPQAGKARPDRLAALTAIPQQPAGYHPPGSGGAESTNPGTQASTTPGKPGDATGVVRIGHHQADQGLLWYLLASFTGGLLALLTPCVFPMIPLTVSFFTKQKTDTGKRSLSGPIAYCLGIIGTFTVLGLGVSIAFGAAGINRLATNPWVNMALAAIFIALAASLFGAFELAAPQWILSRTQKGTNKAGLAGPIFMGLTFSLTSFTCTVPVVGGILASAAQGNLVYPFLGMLAFSTAFALPFFFLAMFPQYLARMPKSGSWLISVKAVMGFVELAFALKFLSNIDLAFQWKLVTRPIFLAVWSAIGLVAGVYLWGWLRLPHDDQGTKIGIPRRVLALVFAAFGVYCLGAIEGAPLGQMEGFLPPKTYTRLGGAEKEWLTNYETALALAKQKSKPLFIDYTGWQCTNCRTMESNTLIKQEVLKEMENFVLVRLYTDRNTPEERANQERLITSTKSSSLPTYAVVSPDGQLSGVFEGLTMDKDKFVQFMKDSLAAAQSRVAQR